MEGEFQHTIRILIRKSLHDKAIEGFRVLRKKLQRAGGTSRLVRDGENFTFTATGPMDPVLDAIDDTRKLERAAADMHQSTVDRLRDMMRKAEGQREKNLDAVLGMVADRLIDKDKKK